MSFSPHTTRYTRGKLPHWEVQDGRYFVTVRCADSLPLNVNERLQEIHESLRLVEPRSESFAALQRIYFRTLEKYLDTGAGECRLRDNRAAQIVVSELTGLEEWKIKVSHYSIMPNHWHALIHPSADCIHPLGKIMGRIKGRTARGINLLSGKTGPLWQREWFDRWMRTDAEYEKCARYIRNNPVKAGLVSNPDEHPWTK